MINLEQEMNFVEFLWGNDADFYERFLGNLPEEELVEFLKENPEYRLVKNKIEE